MWFLWLIFYFMSLVTQSLWQRTYSRKSKLPETFPPAISYILATIPLGIIVGLFMSHHVDWSGWLVSLLIVEGIFIGIFNWLMFVALKRLTVAKFEIIFQLYAVVVIVFGWTLLGEKLSFKQIIGGLLLFSSAYIAMSAPKKKTLKASDKTSKWAVLIAVCAALALGIGLVTEKAALKHMDMGAYFIFGFITQGVAMCLIAVKDLSKSSLAAISRVDVKSSLIMGLQSALVGFTYIAAIQLSNNISLVTTLSTFSLPLIVLAGYIFLHERENMARMWLAAFIGCIGLSIAAIS